MTNLAIIHVDLHRGRFGHASSLLDELAGKTILQHTIDRVARIKGLDEIALMHRADQSLAGKYAAPDDGPRVTTAVTQTRQQDDWLRDVIGSGRKWSLTAWRGGIGGMTIYDELLPAYPWLRVARDRGAESVVALSADWCCIDPALATRQLELHRSAPDALKLTFTQAPPGLSPLVLYRGVLEELSEHGATLANLLCYNPKKPTIDPVGKDVNVPVPAEVRSQYRRFIYDTPRAVEHLQAIAARLGEQLVDADASAVTAASRGVERAEPWRQLERLPQQLNVELSPKRSVNGPIVPQHYLDLRRDDMSRQTIDAMFESLAAETGRAAEASPTSPENEVRWTALAGVDSEASTDPITGSANAPDRTRPIASDMAVLFGGLGDPLLHDDWFQTLVRATGAGLLGVGIETDLLADEAAIDRLATLPLDVIAVRINADRAETYEKLMGIDAYATVMDRLQRLFQARNVNRQKGAGFRGWIVPRLVKVAENLSDMETFFERWMTVSGWAVVDRALTGRGLIPDLSPVPMEVAFLESGSSRADAPPPTKQRLTVLGDGSVCLCGEDWLGRLPIGSLGERGLGELWRSAPGLTDVSVGEPCVCPRCVRWLEAQRRVLASTCSSSDGLAAMKDGR